MFGSPLYPVPPPACWNRYSFDRSAVLSQSQRNALYSGRGRRNFYKCHDVDMDCDDLNQTSARPYCTLSQLEAAKDWVPWVREEYQHHVGMRGISHHTFAFAAVRFGTRAGMCACCGQDALSKYFFTDSPRQHNYSKSSLARKSMHASEPAWKTSLRATV